MLGCYGPGPSNLAEICAPVALGREGRRRDQCDVTRVSSHDRLGCHHPQAMITI